MRRRYSVLLPALCSVIALVARGDCSPERRLVKVASDPDAGLISSSAIPTSIAILRNFPSPRPLPQDRRVPPVETSMYSISATLTEYALDENGDYHLVLTDEVGRTIIAKIPPPECLGGSRFANEITAARNAFAARFPASHDFVRVSKALEIRGVGFFDFLREQRGMAPNGIELHPVTQINLNPLVPPAPPPQRPSKRRATSPGPTAPVCRIPSLSLSISKTSACPGETLTLSWQSSDPAANVAIDGLGSAFPSSGNTTISPIISTVYSARATNVCGTGREAVAVVTLQTAATASLTGPSTMQRGTSATLSISIFGTSAWGLSSSLHNSISPSSGTGSGNFSSTYTATNSGTDTVTLAGTSACGPVTRTLTIFISTPANQGLLCCDGTRSPTCFNCSNKRGCCSSHGGVCGCG